MKNPLNIFKRIKGKINNNMWNKMKFKIMNKQTHKKLSKIKFNKINLNKNKLNKN
jgi:hypothetical protein